MTSVKASLFEFSSAGLFFFFYHKQRVQSVSVYLAHCYQMKKKWGNRFSFSLLLLTGDLFSVSWTNFMTVSSVCSSIDLSRDALKKPL